MLLRFYPGLWLYFYPAHGCRPWAVLHPGAMVLGLLSYVCIERASFEYNKGISTNSFGWGFIHPAFLPFLAGHLIGEIIRKKFSNSPAEMALSKAMAFDC